MANLNFSFGNGLLGLLIDNGDGSYSRHVGGLPASLGAKTAAGSLSVVMASDASSTASGIVTGQYKLTAAAVAISGSQALARGVTIKAKSTNAGTVWIGGSGVTVTDDGTGNGFALRPGDTLSIAVSNLNQIYAIGTANDVIYFAGN